MGVNLRIYALKSDKKFWALVDKAKPKREQYRMHCIRLLNNDILFVINIKELASFFKCAQERANK